MGEMNITKFRQLVVGEKFRRPGSDVLMIKERLRQEPEFGWVNASYCHIHQGRLCYFHDDTPVIRKQSSEGKELRTTSQPLRYQCIQCQKWVAENDAAMSKEGVMCLDCYTLSLKNKKVRDNKDNTPVSLA
jgi:hypothetical protein